MNVTTKLKKGQIQYPDELPPGLDDYLVKKKGFLSCCMIPEGACEIDVIPPL